MNRIVNDFILELPELEVDIDAISDAWIDAHKPEKRFAVLKEMPSDPVLQKLINSLDKNLFNERLTYMLIRFDSYDEYAAHVDASRYTGVNLVIRGNREKSPIKYYNDNDLVNPIFEYPYQKYPILMTSQRYQKMNVIPNGYYLQFISKPITHSRVCEILGYLVTKTCSLQNLNKSHL